MFRLIQHRIQPACSDSLSQLSVWLRIGLLTSLALNWGSSGASAQIILPSQVPLLLAQSAEQATSYPVLHVHPVTGNDSSGDGSDRAPFKTLTQALQVAQPNSLIQLAPGTYSVETGEVFPITLRPRITIQGNPENRGQDVVIQGGGWFSGPSSARRSITILGGANFSTLTGVTITNPTGYGMQVEFSSPTLTDNTFQGNKEGGMVITGNSAPVIRNNFFYQNESVGIRVQNTARPSVQANIFEQTGTAIVVSDRAIPEIIGNRMTHNKTAIVLQGQARPTLGNNSIEHNDQNELVTPSSIALSSQTPSTATIPFGTQLPERAAPATATPAASRDELPAPPTLVRPPVTPPAAAAPPARPVDQPVTPATTITPPAVRPINQPVTPASAIAPSTHITAASFPIPGNSVQSVSQAPGAAPRPIQVIRLTSSSQPANPGTPSLAPPLSSEMPETTVVVQPAKSRSPIPAPLPVTATASALGTQEVSSRRPIRIPIPAVAARSESPSPTGSALTANSQQSSAIPIPVPPPESGTVAPAAPAKPLNTIPSTPSPVRISEQSASILPVPSSEIPLGNIGGMPKVYTTGNPGAVATKSLAGVPVNSAGVTVRYRVVVAATDETQQSQVRSIVPDAFPISYQGRSMMQAGAFSDRAKADQLANTFISQGMNASVEAMQ